MSGRILLVSPDQDLADKVKASLDTASGLLQIEDLSSDDGSLRERFQPDGVVIDSDARTGVQTLFERISGARRQFPGIPVIAIGNEMSAQLVLAALRAGAREFIDRAASARQMQLALESCIAQKADIRVAARSKIAGVLSAMPNDQDQDFALNLGVRAAQRAPEKMVLYVDLSLPASQAGIALGITVTFTAPEAIRELARLDRALLDSALARDPVSGLYVMPLCADFAGGDVNLDAPGFAALLQVLRSIFDIIVIGYGPFSRQPALLEMVQPEAQFFLCCNQRFSSIRGAGDILQRLAEHRVPGVPELVIHEMAPGQNPSPADIRKVLNLPGSTDIGGSWGQFADHFNAGKPVAAASSRYAGTLDACLKRIGFEAPQRTDFRSRWLEWLRVEPAEHAS